MIDAAIRRWSGPTLDRLGDRLQRAGIRAGWVTAAGWVSGVGACVAAASRVWPLALVLWLANRALDGLDGPVARAGTEPTERGALLDIVADFSVYGGFVVAVAIAEPPARLACLALLLAYYASGSTFLALSSLLERQGATSGDERSLRFVGGLAEGAETVAVYVLFCLLPDRATVIAWVFTAAVALTALQRVWIGARYLAPAPGLAPARTLGDVTPGPPVAVTIQYLPGCADAELTPNPGRGGAASLAGAGSRGPPGRTGPRPAMTGIGAYGRPVGSGSGHPCAGWIDGPMTVSRRRDEAFDRWVLPELATMYRVAVAITRDHAEAEDLVQDSLVRAYQALDRFDGANPRAWLLTIVRNTHINRHRRRRPGLLDDPESLDQRSDRTAPGAETEALAAIFDARVEAALRELPASQQAVIELVDVAGLSYQQAAVALDLPVGTVMSRLHRGRKRIKKRLSGMPLPGLEGTGRGGR